MTTISSSVVKNVVFSSLSDGQTKESNVSPLYSVEMLHGAANQMNNSGSVVPFVGTAVLWIQDPTGAVTQNNVTCGSPNGTWSYFNSNIKSGTWKATLHVPYGTGLTAAASPDYEWEVGSSIAAAQ